MNTRTDKMDSLKEQIAAALATSPGFQSGRRYLWNNQQRNRVILTTRMPEDSPPRWCFNCGRPGHTMRNCYQGNDSGASPHVIDTCTMTVAAVKLMIARTWRDVLVEIMWDSGTSMSLVLKQLMKTQGTTSTAPAPQVRLITVSGEELPILGHISALICIDELHNFIQLVVPE